MKQTVKGTWNATKDSDVITVEGDPNPGIWDGEYGSDVPFKHALGVIIGFGPDLTVDDDHGYSQEIVSVVSVDMLYNDRPANLSFEFEFTIEGTEATPADDLIGLLDRVSGSYIRLIEAKVNGEVCEPITSDYYRQGDRDTADYRFVKRFEEQDIELVFVQVFDW